MAEAAKPVPTKRCLVVSPIDHDGKSYVVGATLEGPAPAVDALIKAGAAKPEGERK